MSMDWTYAKWNSFDHAFAFGVEQEGRKGRWGMGQVLSWLLV